MRGRCFDTFAREGERRMSDSMMCGCGKFLTGMAAGMALGTAVGMSMAPSQRQIRRAANKAAKTVSDVMDHLTEAMDL